MLLLATPAASQIVKGRVIDAGDEPVGGVTITLLDTLGVEHRQAASNIAGEFIIMIPASGTYLLRASRLGHETIQTPPIPIGDGEVVEVELRLDAESAGLEPLRVVERRRETWRERDRREFYERVDLYGESHIGSTQIYTRESLERWDALSMDDLFRFHVRWGPYGSGCSPKVFLDGQQREGFGGVRHLSISSLEGLELYAEGGPERSRFWDPDGCGVVLVWTRAVREGRSKLAVVEVVAVVGATVLLTVAGLFLVF